MKKTIITALLMLVCMAGVGQEEKQWSLQAGIGGIKMLENRYDGQYYVPEDEGNAFYVSADYWLSHRVALIGGLTLEQQGLFTNQSDGIGLKKVNMFGIHAGMKYYLFPKKWILQPHIGASVYTNCLNLGHQMGVSAVQSEQGYPGSHGSLSYDVSSPALSLSPRVGVDIRILSSVSLCMASATRLAGM